MSLRKHRQFALRDEYHESIDAWDMQRDISGVRLIVGTGGFNIFRNDYFPNITGSGSVTSSGSTLKFIFRNSVHLNNGYVISSKIEDHHDHKIGLEVSGGVGDYSSHIGITGDESNSFTGDVYISGRSGMMLYKKQGALAVRGNIFVNDDGYLYLSGDEQVSDSSNITLNGKGGSASLLFSGYAAEHMSEKIHNLVVKNKGVIDFFRGTAFHEHGARYLYLDDIETDFSSELLIKVWELGRDHILVRKDSEHLGAALSRIHFEGAPADWHGALEEYDNDYWQIIPGLPEPAGYGAVLGAVGLGLVVCRRRWQRGGQFSWLSVPHLVARVVKTAHSAPH